MTVGQLKKMLSGMNDSSIVVIEAPGYSLTRIDDAYEEPCIVGPRNEIIRDYPELRDGDRRTLMCLIKKES